MGAAIVLPWIERVNVNRIYRRHVAESLQGRLLLAVTFVLLFFLGITGAILERAFLNGVESNVKEKLQTQLYALLTAAEESDGKLKMPDILQEQRLNQLSSGLYGYVSDASGQVIWRSPSALGQDISFPSGLNQGQQQFGDSIAQDGVPVFYLTQGIAWEMFSGAEPLFNFTIVESQAPLLAQLKSFRRTLWLWLGAMALLLLVGQVVLLRWGMRPVQVMAEELAQIESGKAEQLEGAYPRELEGLSRNLNLLVQNERRQRERYKNTMSDLAHSLKTPLAVLRGLKSTTNDMDEYTALVEEQVERMDQIVKYQLRRTVSAGPASIISGVEIKPVVSKTLSALQKYIAINRLISLSIVDLAVYFLAMKAI